MGNQTSSGKRDEDIYKLPGMIDSIAAKYILTQDFKDMTQLENKEYCNKLIVLTSKIIKQHLNEREIEFLSQRTEKGVEINKMAKDKVMFVKDDSLRDLDESNSIKKQRMCIGIAKFYIKIMHVFSAIVATMNPTYNYKNEIGTRQSVPYMQKKNIPTASKDSVTIDKINLCSRRINALMAKILDETEDKSTTLDANQTKPIISDAPKVSHIAPAASVAPVIPPPVQNVVLKPDVKPLIEESNESNENGTQSNEVVTQSNETDKMELREEIKLPNNEQTSSNEPTEKKAPQIDLLRSLRAELDAQKGGEPPKTLEIRPRFCSANKNKDGTQMNLANEPGIPELKQLYYDVFDYKVGKFTSMSEASEKEFKRDLETFYKAFTGKSSMPDDIKGFSNITLRDFSLHENCAESGLFNKVYQGSLKNKLFKKYADQLKMMTDNANQNREKLISILDRLFRYVKDPATGTTKKITLRPDLTEKSLQSIVSDTRKIIIQLYVNCEKEYLGIIETFESIVETQVKRVTQQKMDGLKQQQEKMMTK